MSDTRLPQQLLYGDLSYGKRSQGGQRKRFKDSLKNNLKRFDIDTGLLGESAAADRSRWRTAIRGRQSSIWRADGRPDLSDKRLKRKHHEAEARARPPATSSDFNFCTHCGKDCHSSALASSATMSHTLRKSTPTCIGVATVGYGEYMYPPEFWVGGTTDQLYPPEFEK